MKNNIFLFVLLILFLLGSSENAVAQPVTDWSQIAIVWPHDLKGQYAPVGQSSQVNISVWPRTAVACTQTTDVTLWMSKNNEPAQPLSISPQIIHRVVNGVNFPSLEFNNIPADLVTDPSAIYHFVVVGSSTFSNVWTHASIPQAEISSVTPLNFVETDELELIKTGIDARIEKVSIYNADGKSVSFEQATRVDLVSGFFLHNTLNSTGAPNTNYGGPLLLVAEGNEPLRSHPDEFGKERFGTLDYMTHSSGGRIWFPQIIYKNISVEPQKSYQFALGGFDSPPMYSSFWTLASDIRTNLPSPIIPPSCVE